MAMTKLKDLVDPQVMADMVSAKLPKKIKFTPIARIDTTLEGRPGSTITVPKYAYIGDAEDVAEGVAMGTTVLTASTTEAKVKKAGKAVELTDESVLSGYGDPVGTAVNQLTMSIAAKVDNDGYDALCGASLAYDGTATEISYRGVVSANAKFEDESDASLTKIIFIHPNQEATLLNDDDFKSNDKYPLNVIMSGTIGSIAGAQVVKSKKVKLIKYELDDSTGTVTIVANETTEDATNIHLDTAISQVLDKTGLKVGSKLKAVAAPYYACPIVIVSTEDPNEAADADGVSEEEAALTIYMKRDVEIESDRDILAKTTVISADEHYTAVLSNESKVVLAKFKA
nr:MAG TPA: major capsid protein [Caudoviricetes sp.]